MRDYQYVNDGRCLDLFGERPDGKGAYQGMLSAYKLGKSGRVQMVVVKAGGGTVVSVHLSKDQVARLASFLSGQRRGRHEK